MPGGQLALGGWTVHAAVDMNSQTAVTRRQRKAGSAERPCDGLDRIYQGLVQEQLLGCDEFG